MHTPYSYKWVYLHQLARLLALIWYRREKSEYGASLHYSFWSNVEPASASAVRLLVGRVWAHGHTLFPLGEAGREPGQEAGFCMYGRGTN